MTDKTPLEKLHEAITASVFEESSIRDAKVKNEFADKVRSYQTVVKEMQGTINELQAKLKAWEDAPKVTVKKGSFLAVGWAAKYGSYHLKPKEAEDAQGN